MVNPLVSNVGSVPVSPVGIEPERPARLPEPAMQVTATAETIKANNALSSPRQGDSDSQNSLEKALELVNSSMEAWSTGMRFDVDPEAQRVVVSIIDSATGEVLRTVPSDAVIRVAKMIVQLQGQSVNTKA
ncbi:MAG TPA: flagellar protein FlaG [Eoetvoesiella sp.]